MLHSTDKKNLQKNDKKKLQTKSATHRNNDRKKIYSKMRSKIESIARPPAAIHLIIICVYNVTALVLCDMQIKRSV